MSHKNYFVAILIIIVMGGVVWISIMRRDVKVPAPSPKSVTNFEECVSAGNPVMESYPRRCNSKGQTFTENIGDKLDKSNLIRLTSPRPNEVIHSPLMIEGEARGKWFFEASFPVVLTDWDGLIIAQGIATAKSDWMTEEFVPFTATLTFKNPTYKNNGSLILKRDNPSGLPENDDALEVPIIFEKIEEPSPIVPTSIAPYDSGVIGKVSLGPTCPVMRNPPDPQCADKGYKTTVQIFRMVNERSSLFAHTESNEEGLFKIMLPPGEYTVSAIGGNMLPRCNTETITVKPSVIVKQNISCDTGIR